MKTIVKAYTPLGIFEGVPTELEDADFEILMSGLENHTLDHLVLNLKNGEYITIPESVIRNSVISVNTVEYDQDNFKYNVISHVRPVG